MLENKNAPSYLNAKFIFNLKRFLLCKKLIKNIYLVPNVKEYNQKYVKENKKSIEVNTDWIKLCREITSPKIISTFSNIIVLAEKLYQLVENNVNTFEKDIKVSKTRAKSIGVIFTIAFFPDIVCNNNVIHKHDIIKLSQKITLLIEDIYQLKNGQKDNFIKLVKFSYFVNEFNILFNAWQSADKEYTLFTMAKKYLINEIKMTQPLSKNETIDGLYLDIFKKEQHSIKLDIQYLGDQGVTNQFNDLISNLGNYDKIEKKLYWINIEYHINTSPPNLGVISDLFKETKRLIKNLILNRKDLQDELDDILDVTILDQVLKEQTLDEPFFINKCLYILDWLKKLQSASLDKDLDAFRADVQSKLTSGIKIEELVIFFFKYVLDRLEVIHDEKEAFISFVKKINS